MKREVRRTLRLDPATDELLARIAGRFEDNASMAARWAIKQAAANEPKQAPRPAAKQGE